MLKPKQREMSESIEGKFSASPLLLQMKMRDDLPREMEWGAGVRGCVGLASRCSSIVQINLRPFAQTQQTQMGLTKQCIVRLKKGLQFAFRNNWLLSGLKQSKRERPKVES